MQNYRYRSSGNSRGCMRQPDSSRELCAGIALDQMPVTMAYVPWTKWRNIYEAEKGLRRGTIFQDLDKPWNRRLSKWQITDLAKQSFWTGSTL